MTYNYMSRNIGIYCINRENAKKLLKQIVECIPNDSINKIKNSSCEQHIEMKDGTSYCFVVPSDHARGYAFHEAYIQPGIDKVLYDTIICPCVKIGQGTIYLVEELKDFWFRNKLADKYYEQIQNGENNI